MSEEAKQQAENTEVIRKLVVPPKTQVESEDGDRSPTKDRDLTTEGLATADAATSGEVDVVRELVVPKPQSEDEEGDRSPTKTERDLATDVIANLNEETVESSETVRKKIVPDA